MKKFSCKPNIYVSWSTSEIRVRLVPSNIFKSSNNFYRPFQGRSFRLFVFHVCDAVLSVPCHLVATRWEKADLMALLYVMFYCVFITLPYGVLGQVWYLIVLIPDICLLPYFHVVCQASR